jgi:hypothetical protein
LGVELLVRRTPKVYFKTPGAVLHEKRYLEPTGPVPADYRQRVVVMVNGPSYQAAQRTLMVEVIQIANCVGILIPMDLIKIIIWAVFFDPDQLGYHFGRAAQAFESYLLASLAQTTICCSTRCQTLP